MVDALMLPTRVRVLLVDDESLIRRAVRRTFAALAEVTIEDFEHGPDAIARARESTFDVALLDLHMPGMNGVEVARQLRELQPACRLVFMTATPGSPLCTQAKLMSDVVLGKPWSSRDLVQAVAGPF